MCDSISLTDEEFQSTYQQAVQTWARLPSEVGGKSEFPIDAFFVPGLSQGHPTLPHSIDLMERPEGVFAVGYTLWSSIRPRCSPGLPSFRQSLQIKVATETPTYLTFSRNDADEARISPFEKGDNYLPTLMLAWAYILSARWAETMFECCSMAYTQALSTLVGPRDAYHFNQNTAPIILENADTSEVRWWAAVLAPGQGWEARMRCQDKTFMSPWSVVHRAGCKFVVQHSVGDLPPFCPTASSLDAINYLDKFCAGRDIIDQSHAALAAVLLLPSMGIGRTLILPGPAFATPGPSRSSRNFTRRARRTLRHDWVYKDCHLDRLLTLSTNAKGIRPMLLSAFYEPSVKCNAVTPWLQGMMAAIDHLAESDPYMIVRLCMERAPKVAFLWLGAFALDLQWSLIQEARFGQIPVDLHSAAWSETIQSFIQQRTSVPLARHGFVSRADECRLLFLTQSGPHARLPLCQWQPFGTTPLEDTDIEVRIHQTCGDHKLRYEGVVWRCEDNKEIFQPSCDRTNDLKLKRVPAKPAWNDSCSMPICSNTLDRDREVISENATRMIFGWLRHDGHASHEASIWNHEWFGFSDSDEDSVLEDESAARRSHGSMTRLMSWLSDGRLGRADLD